MKYQTIASKSYTLSPWIGVFNALKLPEFKHFYRHLDFPIEPTQAMRNIAWGFIAGEYYLRSGINRKTPKTALNILDTIDREESSERKLDILFQNTFLYLEQEHYAKEVYLWGLQTAHAHMLRGNYHKIKAFSGATQVLRNWAIVERQKQSESLGSLYHEDLIKLFEDWDRIELRAPITQPILELTQISRLNLYEIILEHELELLSLTKKLQSVSNVNEDENFEFKESEYWIHGEGIFRIKMRQWRRITGILSQEELLILENWIEQQKLTDRFVGDIIIIPLPFI